MDQFSVLILLLLLLLHLLLLPCPAHSDLQRSHSLSCSPSIQKSIMFLSERGRASLDIGELRYCSAFLWISRASLVAFFWSQCCGVQKRWGGREWLLPGARGIASSTSICRCLSPNLAVLCLVLSFGARFVPGNPSVLHSCPMRCSRCRLFLFFVELMQIHLRFASGSAFSLNARRIHVLLASTAGMSHYPAFWTLETAALISEAVRESPSVSSSFEALHTLLWGYYWAPIF